MGMSFRVATDRAGEFVTHQQLADELGASVQSVRAARLDPDSPNFRRPPPSWEQALARLARKRAAELEKLADQLERNSS